MTNEKIEEVATSKANSSFVESYCTPENLRERKIEGLGIAIAQWSDWDGKIIMEVFKSALEDANFHDQAAQVQEMIDSL